MLAPSRGSCENLVIQGFKPEFMERVLEVENECFPPALRYSEILFSYYYAHGSIFKVAFCDNVLVGYALADVENSVCHVVSIAVVQAYRGLGVGKALLGDLIAECKARGARRAYLEVSTRNERALRLYSGAGFRVIGFIKGYYGNEDAYVMVKELT